MCHILRHTYVRTQVMRINAGQNVDTTMCAHVYVCQVQHCDEHKIKGIIFCISLAESVVFVVGHYFI